MKLTTKANIGDTLYWILEPVGYKVGVMESKVTNITINIDKDEYFEIYQAENYKERTKCNYINSQWTADWAGVFTTRKEAETVAKRISLKLKSEIENQKKFNKQYEKDRAIEEIAKIARKNKIRIEIK